MLVEHQSTAETVSPSALFVLLNVKQMFHPASVQIITVSHNLSFSLLLQLIVHLQVIALVVTLKTFCCSNCELTK